MAERFRALYRHNRPETRNGGFLPAAQGGKASTPTLGLRRVCPQLCGVGKCGKDLRFDLPAKSAFSVTTGRRTAAILCDTDKAMSVSNMHLSAPFWSLPFGLFYAGGVHFLRPHRKISARSSTKKQNPLRQNAAAGFKQHDFILQIRWRGFRGSH
jgi:hypothetical protein